MKHTDINFIFSTLWSKISPENEWQIERRMGDFHLIKYNGFRFSSDQFNQFHDESMSFLKRELESKTTNKTVVVTHHAPTFLYYPEKFKGDLLNEAFAIELFDFIESSGPDYWIYGHHHSNTPDFSIGKTRLVTNQLGYIESNEHYLFSTEKVFEL